MHANGTAAESDVFDVRLGERLRATRAGRAMRLKDVERCSRGEFKASVLGAYERGQRRISATRLLGLAAIYHVPVHSLLPPDDPQGDDMVDSAIVDPRLRVMVVEDDTANRELVRRLLDGMGVRDIEFARDSESMLPLVMDFDPELLIIDRHLGPTDSFEVLRELSLKDPRWDERAILVVTGDARMEVREAAALSGAHELLLKPYSRLAFIDAVQRVLARHDIATEAARSAPPVNRLGELEEANRRLRAADAAKTDFIARVSHELRGPLTAILGFGDLLGKAHLAAPHDEWAELVVRAGHHLLGLVNDLLDVSRMEAGEFSLSCVPTRVAEILGDVEELSMNLAAQHSTSLHVTPLPDIDIAVLADGQRLRQVLLNLVSNGIKYNKPGGSVGIAVHQPSPELVRIAVTDTGLGMTAEEQARLFTPFDRLHAEADGIEGIGLGLTLSRNLVERMQGTLTVTSSPGSGSTFTIELPAP